jgi:hypothetical protein
MRVCRFLHLLAAWAVLAGTATAADLSRVDHTIKKEPVYRSKPKYGLLVLGPEAKVRIWLVLDGDTLYVDRNGNGDLTEAGERVRIKTPDRDPAAFEEVEITAAGLPVRPRLEVWAWNWFDLRFHNKANLEPSLDVTWVGQQRYGAWGDERGPLTFATRPQDAPVVHVGGPLQMGFEVRRPLEKVGDRTYKLSAAVGTPGLGPGTFAHLKYNVIPAGVHPRAVLEFPNRKAGHPPVRVEMVLKERC